MWIAIIRGITLLLGLSIFAFGGVGEKVSDVVVKPVEEVGKTIKIATPIILILGTIWAFSQFSD